MLFAIVIERNPLQWADFPGGLLLWLQSAGGFAAAAIVLWLLVGLPRMREEDRKAIPGWQSTLFVVLTGLAFLGYAVYVIAVLANSRGLIAGLALTFAGACALVAVGLPFVLNLFKMRLRRVYALAKLSFKEAIRRRVLYAFTGMLLVFLFASWFIPSQTAPKDEVRTYVQVVYTAMGLLLLITAMLLSAFSIPADIKQQTIHTIVTKPVERFEVVLGRFLGFLALMTVVLVVMSSLSLLYVLREIQPEAAAESLKAREPAYGELRFENTDNERQAINVGREWEYRQYISRPLPGQRPVTARWDFAEVAGSLGNRQQVRCEYTFDIYRTTKGVEGRAVSCTFRFYTWRYREGDDEAFRKERRKLIDSGSDARTVDNELTEKYGYYEINSQPVVDYHTQAFVLPGGLFRNATASDAEREKELKQRGTAGAGVGRPPRLVVRVTCDSPTQYVGMAQHDFYIRLDESDTSERLLFALNFFKGTFGLWLLLALIIGLAVVLSTYLNGVISLLVTLVLYLGGLSREFIESVALGKNVGGGPMEAMVRMTRRELTGPRMEDSTSIGDQIVSRSDAAFRWTIQRIINIVPDVDRFDLTNYVAEGFNIAPGQLALSFLLLVGYLLPWAVLAFYLIRWREVASTQ